MLCSFSNEHFKSYRKATFKLAPLTVLIGSIALGKSNAIEAKLVDGRVTFPTR